MRRLPEYGQPEYVYKPGYKECCLFRQVWGWAISKAGCMEGWSILYYKRVRQWSVNTQESVSILLRRKANNRGRHWNRRRVL